MKKKTWLFVVVYMKKIAKKYSKLVNFLCGHLLAQTVCLVFKLPGKLLLLLSDLIKLLGSRDLQVLLKVFPGL
jgi:hypothetical protein